MFWYNLGKVLVTVSTPLLFVALCQLRVEILRYREHMRLWTAYAMAHAAANEMTLAA